MKKSELLVPLGVNILSACNVNVLMGETQAFISLFPTSLNFLNIMTRVWGGGCQIISHFFVICYPLPFIFFQ